MRSQIGRGRIKEKFERKVEAISLCTSLFRINSRGQKVKGEKKFV